MATTIKIENGDIVISSVSGRPVVISGSNKIRQELYEFFSINIQYNGFGSGLEQLIGLTTVDSNVIASLADRQIRDGIADFIAIQKADVLTNRTPDEIIVGITQVQVQQDRQDPTKYSFFVNVLTQSGTAIPINISLGGI
jgi:hypothetical protein